MPTLTDVEGWKGRTVVDPDGDKVGTLEEFYLDRQSGDPTWAAIRTGLFGTHTSLAPLDGAALSGNDVRLGYSKSAVKDAPANSWATGVGRPSLMATRWLGRVKGKRACGGPAVPPRCLFGAAGPTYR